MHFTFFSLVFVMSLNPHVNFHISLLYMLFTISAPLVALGHFLPLILIPRTSFTHHNFSHRLLSSCCVVLSLDPGQLLSCARACYVARPLVDWNESATIVMSVYDCDMSVTVMIGYTNTCETRRCDKGEYDNHRGV
ncbi:hypothetical protein BXZ70DRAFT_333553 [Cristinia sonorae]|uniref:Uncharacterized protein n=1 Tax=Cristinia sonorae TaxID=1940300 RepID=A0A8K0UMJ9_9AGAR|nr:hypothetical protein BXZ70DRAFT_333553 [Cristinia sonorae]